MKIKFEFIKTILNNLKEKVYKTTLALIFDYGVRLNLINY